MSDDEPPRVDLEPDEYRRAGEKQPNWRRLRRWLILSAVWAAAVISVARYMIEGESPIVVALIALGPGAIMFLILLLRD